MATFFDHLAEFRRKLVRCVLAVVIGAAIAHYFHEVIIAFLLAPIHGRTLYFLSPLDSIIFIMKTDFLVGFVAALPIINWSLFSFVRPAMKSSSWLLFSALYCTAAALILAALAYAYFIMVPISLNFLLGITIPGVNNLITATSYLNFLLVQSLITALLFQIPLFIVAGAYIGALEMKTLASKRRYIYVGGLTVLAILAPSPDLFTFGIVAIPALIMFEGSLIAGRVVQWTKRRESGADTPSR